MADKDNRQKEFIFDELKVLSDKVSGSKGMPEELRERADQMIERLNRMAKLGHYASEFDTLSRYIEVITSIPWSSRTTDNLGLDSVREVLDKNHYGMEAVKELVLEYLATMALIGKRGENAIAQSPILLLVGLQGVGKTTLAESISEAMGRKFVRIAIGALGSVLELRGKSKALPGAEPGQIVKALIRTQVRNPVILLDEIEKASGEVGLRSDIMAALLEILDPRQNRNFRDHYVDFPIDLSEVLFVCSANNTGTISAALMDRMQVVKMPAYSDDQKIVIARDYLLPKVIENAGLKPEEFTIDPSLWPNVVRPFGFDTGIRSLGRTLEAMARKVAKQIVTGEVEKVHITQENLKSYLPSGLI